MVFSEKTINLYQFFCLTIIRSCTFLTRYDRGVFGGHLDAIFFRINASCNLPDDITYRDKSI